MPNLPTSSRRRRPAGYGLHIRGIACASGYVWAHIPAGDWQDAPGNANRRRAPNRKRRRFHSSAAAVQYVISSRRLNRTRPPSRPPITDQNSAARAWGNMTAIAVSSNEGDRICLPWFNSETRRYPRAGRGKRATSPYSAAASPPPPAPPPPMPSAAGRTFAVTRCAPSAIAAPPPISAPALQAVRASTLIGAAIPDCSADACPVLVWRRQKCSILIECSCCLHAPTHHNPNT